jgi:hypothetical protein
MEATTTSVNRAPLSEFNANASPEEQLDQIIALGRERCQSKGGRPKLTELKSLATKLGITGVSNKDKKDLVAMIFSFKENRVATLAAINPQTTSEKGQVLSLDY